MGYSDSSWKILPIGAGGFVTGIDVAPDNTMVVRTDTYGAYVWDGGQWDQLITSESMPTDLLQIDLSQGVYEIRIAPSDSDVLYMSYLGGVYRSDNRGANWVETQFSRVLGTGDLLFSDAPN